jgi:tRNA A-37 threonylcarbamoyl transferase component Bud32
MCEGTLQEKLGQVKPFEIVKGIVEGMIHLHKHNIVHGNLTCKNILLTKNGEPKISVLFLHFFEIINFSCV